MKRNNETRKVHILLIIRWPVGGIRTFLRYVYREFDARRYRLTILAPDCQELKTLLEDLRDFEISCHPLPEYVSSRAFLRAICRTILLGKYDLIHSQGLTAGIMAIVPALLRRCPHLLTIHDGFNEPQFRGPVGLLKKTTISLSLPLIDIIHTVSQDAKNNLLEYVSTLRIFTRKVVSIPNGVETSRFAGDEKLDLREELQLSPDVFLIGFFGRFMSPKGFVYLAEAVHRLAGMPNLPRKPVVLAFGDGGFIREEKIALRRHGIDQYFHFMPFVPNIAPVLRGLDVVAMPSIWEACPLLPMEAMVAGVPLIGTNCRGLREVLRDTPAITVPARDSERLADALLNEMNEPSKSSMGAFREEASHRFDVKTQAIRLERIIAALIHRKYLPHRQF